MTLAFAGTVIVTVEPSTQVANVVCEVEYVPAGLTTVELLLLTLEKDPVTFTDPLKLFVPVQLLFDESIAEVVDKVIVGVPMLA